MADRKESRDRKRKYSPPPNPHYRRSPIREREEEAQSNPQPIQALVPLPPLPIRRQGPSKTDLNNFLQSQLEIYNPDGGSLIFSVTKKFELSAISDYWRHLKRLNLLAPKSDIFTKHAIIYKRHKIDTLALLKSKENYRSYRSNLERIKKQPLPIKTRLLRSLPPEANFEYLNKDFINLTEASPQLLPPPPVPPPIHFLQSLASYYATGFPGGSTTQIPTTSSALIPNKEILEEFVRIHRASKLAINYLQVLIDFHRDLQESANKLHRTFSGKNIPEEDSDKKQ